VKVKAIVPEKLKYSSTVVPPPPARTASSLKRPRVDADVNILRKKADLNSSSSNSNSSSSSSSSSEFDSSDDDDGSEDCSASEMDDFIVDDDGDRNAENELSMLLPMLGGSGPACGMESLAAPGGGSDDDKGHDIGGDSGVSSEEEPASDDQIFVDNDSQPDDCTLHRLLEAKLHCIAAKRRKEDVIIGQQTISGRSDRRNRVRALSNAKA
jgi:hypothetical protein